MAYTYDNLVQWAAQYFPALKFSRGPGDRDELFYPCDAEAWLRHRSNTAQAPHLRGTSIFRWRAAKPGSGAELWRGHDADVAPGAITFDADAQTGIAHGRFLAPPPLNPLDPASGPSDGDWYLDFGGWSDAADRSFGQLTYPSTVWDDAFVAAGLPVGAPPPEPDGVQEDLSNAQPSQFAPGSTLHAYAEFGSLSRIIAQLANVQLPAALASLQQERTVLQGKASELEHLLGLTYHLFYPVYTPPDGKLMEGQWEAISLFFEDKGSGSLSRAFAAYTQGYENRGIGPGLFPRPLSRCNSIGDVEWQGDHPVVYVAWGSHANYFTPRSTEQTTEVPVDSGAIWVGVGLFGLAALAALAGGVLIVAGVACIVGTLDLAVPCWLVVAAGVALLVLAISLAAAAVALLAASAAEEQAETLPFDETPRPDSHAGDGAAPPPGAVGTPDQPPPGAVPEFMLHPISADPDIDDKRAAPPAWWGYVGRWGVCVNDLQAEADPPGWSNGAWRRRPDGYTATHRNVEALIDLLHEQADSEAGG
jgi:hypothetical protein